MKDTYRYCKFLDRGVECWNGRYGTGECGCKTPQMALGFRPGLSRSHRRAIRKQLRQQELLKAKRDAVEQTWLHLNWLLTTGRMT